MYVRHVESEVICASRRSGRLGSAPSILRFASVAQLAEHVIGNDEVSSSNLLGSSSTALRWGVARLAIGRNDAAVNKRTSKRLWNALGLKQFCFGGGSTLGNKKPEMKVKSFPKHSCAISSVGRAGALLDKLFQFLLL